ncbi:MAG TPA: acylphosphatase [Candidatus Udaeobacter sp.]|nr:acylphosphatase [Candidatus Udaeobacter sp.]
MLGSGYGMLVAGISCGTALRSGIGYLGSRILEQVMISLQVFYEGRVQGVGFRFSVRHIAKGFDVTGWVRNLPDGRVELQVTGEDSEVRAFLDQITQSELHSLIGEQTENKLKEPVAARGFEIRHD